MSGAPQDQSSDSAEALTGYIESRMGATWNSRKLSSLLLQALIIAPLMTALVFSFIYYFNAPYPDYIFDHSWLGWALGIGTGVVTLFMLILVFAVVRISANPAAFQQLLQNYDAKNSYAASILKSVPAQARGNQTSIKPPVLVRVATYIWLSTVFILPCGYFYVNAFAWLENYFYLILLLQPLTLLLFALCCKNNSVQSFIAQFPFKISPTILTCLGLVSLQLLIMTLGASALLLNQFLDQTSGNKTTFTVIDKNYNAFNKDKIPYYAIIETSFPSPFIKDGKTHHDAIRISPEDYNLIKPGATRLTVITHPGLLGFPWYENRVTMD